jgi:hypothetical protein
MRLAPGSAFDRLLVLSNTALDRGPLKKGLQPGQARHARAAATAERPGGRAGQQAALLLGQVRAISSYSPPSTASTSTPGTYRPGMPPQQLSDNLVMRGPLRGPRSTTLPGRP